VTDEPQTERKWNLTVTLPDDLRRALAPLRQTGQIQISPVVEKALRDALADARAPGKAGVVRRLKLARSRRRGPDYDLGFEEGRHWAEDVATWDEIRRYGRMPTHAIGYTHGSEGTKLEGPFQPPPDYPDAPFHRNREGLLVEDRDAIFPYWDGWLAGVSSVQATVADEMESVSSPAFIRERPSDLDTDLETIRAQLAAEAEEEFKNGYRAGVEAAKNLSWHVLSDFAEEGFDLRRWLISLEHSSELESKYNLPTPAGFQNVYAPLEKALGGLVSPDGADWYPPFTYQEGFTQALKDIWDSVQRGKPTTNQAKEVRK
jgi:hypothetical protein